MIPLILFGTGEGKGVLCVCLSLPISLCLSLALLSFTNTATDLFSKPHSLASAPVTQLELTLKSLNLMVSSQRSSSSTWLGLVEHD